MNPAYNFRVYVAITISANEQNQTDQTAFTTIESSGNEGNFFKHLGFNSLCVSMIDE